MFKAIIFDNSRAGTTDMDINITEVGDAEPRSYLLARIQVEWAEVQQQVQDGHDVWMLDQGDRVLVLCDNFEALVRVVANTLSKES